MMQAVLRNRSCREVNCGSVLHSLGNHQKGLVRHLEELMRRKVQSNYGILFNETCINEDLLPRYTDIYIYIFKLKKTIRRGNVFYIFQIGYKSCFIIVLLLWVYVVIHFFVLYTGCRRLSSKAYSYNRSVNSYLYKKRLYF